MIYGYLVVYAVKDSVGVGTVINVRSKKIKTPDDIKEVEKSIREDAFILSYKRVKLSRQNKKDYKKGVKDGQI